MSLFPDMPQPFDRFDLWWSAYPRRVCKGDARKAFAKLKVNDAMLDVMLAALEWQKKQEQWQDLKYVPHAATYLHREQWTDERPEPVQVKRTDDDWFEQCQQLHQGACGGRAAHAGKMGRDAIRLVS